MYVAVMDQNDDINILRSIGLEWKAAANGEEYGLPLDEQIGLATLQNLTLRNDGDVLVLLSDNDAVRGFMGLTYRPNHVGPGLIANECLFYVSPSARSGGLKLISAARKLAKAKGCDFLFLNASRVAGDGDRSAKLYQRLGFRHIESSYMEAL